MAKQDIERLKKLVEEKHGKHGAHPKNSQRAQKTIGNFQKAFRNKKRSGMFDQ